MILCDQCTEYGKNTYDKSKKKKYDEKENASHYLLFPSPHSPFPTKVYSIPLICYTAFFC